MKIIKKLNITKTEMKEVKNVLKSGKLIKVFLSYDKNNIINSIKITGDFFLYPEESLEKLEENLIGTKLDRNLIRKKIHKSLSNSEPYGFNEKSLTDAIVGCLNGGRES